MNTLDNFITPGVQDRKKRIRNKKEVVNPYIFLLLAILKQAFDDVEAYLYQTRTDKEREEGKIAIVWLHDKDGCYRLIVEAAMCINGGLDDYIFDEWIDNKLELMKNKQLCVKID